MLLVIKQNGKEIRRIERHLYELCDYVSKFKDEEAFLRNFGISYSPDITIELMRREHKNSDEYYVVDDLYIMFGDDYKTLKKILKDQKFMRKNRDKCKGYFSDSVCDKLKYHTLSDSAYTKEVYSEMNKQLTRLKEKNLEEYYRFSIKLFSTYQIQRQASKISYADLNPLMQRDSIFYPEDNYEKEEFLTEEDNKYCIQEDDDFDFYSEGIRYR